MREYIAIWAKVYRYTVFNLTKTRIIGYQQWNTFLDQASEADIQLCYDQVVAWENRLGSDLIQRGEVYQNIEIRVQLQAEEDAKRQTA